MIVSAIFPRVVCRSDFSSAESARHSNAYRRLENGASTGLVDRGSGLIGEIGWRLTQPGGLHIDMNGPSRKCLPTSALSMRNGCGQVSIATAVSPAAGSSGLRSSARNPRRRSACTSGLAVECDETVGKGRNHGMSLLGYVPRYGYPVVRSRKHSVGSSNGGCLTITGRLELHS